MPMVGMDINKRFVIGKVAFWGSFKW